MKTFREIREHIVKVAGGYELKSKKTGRNLGKYPDKAGAEKREREVQYFKHMGEEYPPKVYKELYKGLKLHFARGNRGGKSSSSRGGASASGANGDGGSGGGGSGDGA
jgi:hypothetical protein